MEEENAAPEPEAAEPSWYLDENTPGTGDRPDWLQDKFKSASDMAKSYRALETKMGSAPNEYDFTSSDSWFDSTSDAAKNMAAKAKANNVSQEVLGDIMQVTGDYLKSHQIDEAAEMAEIGDNAQDRMKNLGNWMKSTFSEHTASELAESVNTAAKFKAFEEVRNGMINNMNTVPSNNSESANAPTVAEVTSEMTENYDKFKTDTKYRNEITQKLERATANMSHLDKSSF